MNKSNYIIKGYKDGFSNVRWTNYTTEENAMDVAIMLKKYHYMDAVKIYKDGELVNTIEA